MFFGGSEIVVDLPHMMPITGSYSLLDQIISLTELWQDGAETERLIPFSFLSHPHHIPFHFCFILLKSAALDEY